MSYIAKVPVKNHIYLYECEGYRVDGKVKSRRMPIGKIDPKTNQPIYKREYIERMKALGEPVSNDNEPMYSVNDIKNSTIKEIGLIQLLDKIANESGLMKSLRNSNPKYCDKIFTIARHLVASGEPFMHCQEWLENIEITENVGSMSSQSISRILSNISPNDIEGFYQEWAKCRSEKEYLALDITSTSSYSQLIEDVEWGYNRDGENLPQINLCMLMGETSRLPIYQTPYQGSLRDVSTLKTTFKKFDAITNGSDILAVMDKGFYSKKNVDAMLCDNIRFAIAVPFSNAFAKKLVNEFRDSIDDFSNNIVIGNDTLRSVTKECKWGKKPIFAHVYYNQIKAVNDREKLYRKVDQMFKQASSKPQDYLNNKDFSKYIDIQKVGDKYDVQIKNDAVNNAKRHTGWLVIISNHINNALHSIQIYRNKDVVEKGFDKLKNCLDLARLRVHSDTNMQSKIFICFIALVLLSNIHNVMVDKDLYKVYTVREMMRILSKHRIQNIGSDRIEFPPTKQQRRIYEAFGIDAVSL